MLKSNKIAKTIKSSSDNDTSYLMGKEDLLSWCLSCWSGFPYTMTADWRVIYCNGLLYVFPTRNIVSFHALISLFNCNILFKGTIWPVCADSAVKPQSISPSVISFMWPCSYNYELVFGVGVHGLDKADRLIYGESLMTHAMVLTAVHEQVCLLTYCLFTCLLTC